MWWAAVILYCKLARARSAVHKVSLKAVRCCYVSAGCEDFACYDVVGSGDCLSVDWCTRAVLGIKSDSQNVRVFCMHLQAARTWTAFMWRAAVNAVISTGARAYSAGHEA
jgi:hypothetical protein